MLARAPLTANNVSEVLNQGSDVNTHAYEGFGQIINFFFRRAVHGNPTAPGLSFRQFYPANHDIRLSSGFARSPRDSSRCEGLKVPIAKFYIKSEKI